MEEESPDRPNWLDDEFLKTCIKNSQNLTTETNILIKDVALTYVVPKGENFMSVLNRVQVTYQVEEGQVCEETFVVKVAFESNKMGKVLISWFNKEIDMYVNLVPKLEKILENNNIEEQFICRYFHTIDEPKVIVLEDLKPLRYVVADRHVGLDLTHCKAVYRKIAKLHAAGMCYFYSQTDEQTSKYSVSSFQVMLESDIGDISVQKTRVKANIKELEEHDGRYLRAIDFFRKYDELLDQTKVPLTAFIPGNKFNSLNHTDFWVNNILFKYKQDGSIEDLLLVDLQAMHYTSVAYDFLLFFLSSSTLEVRQNNYDELKEFYFNSLVSNLHLLEYEGDIPTIREFEEELKRSTLTPMFCLTYLLPIVVQTLDKEMKSREKSEAFAVEDFGKMLENSYTDRNYLDKMLASVDILQDYGFMDKPPEMLRQQYS